MSQFRRLSESVFASPQISLDDVAAAAEEGVKMIVCNRPDDEDPGQLSSAAVSQAASAAGMDYVAIPISHGRFGEPEVAAMAEALGSASGKVLAYCRTGTRSTLLWALAETLRGGDPDQLAQQAADAGYDVAPVRPAMDMLAVKTP